MLFISRCFFPFVLFQLTCANNSLSITLIKHSLYSFLFFMNACISYIISKEEKNKNSGSHLLLNEMELGLFDHAFQTYITLCVYTVCITISKGSSSSFGCFMYTISCSKNKNRKQESLESAKNTNKT